MQITQKLLLKQVFSKAFFKLCIKMKLVILVKIFAPIFAISTLKVPQAILSIICFVYYHYLLISCFSCNFTKSNTPRWVFFTFLKWCKCYQIAQSVLNVLHGPKYPSVNTGHFLLSRHNLVENFSKKSSKEQTKI